MTHVDKRRRGAYRAKDLGGSAATLTGEPGYDGPDGDVEATPGAIDGLRRRFFAEAGAVAARYGIEFERVLTHLTDLDAGRSIDRVEHLADLVHAVACVDEVGIAWADLSEHYEQVLVQGVEGRLGRPDAVLLVRRLLVDLRHAARGARFAGMIPLQRYNGHTSLAKWLAVRLAARFSQQRVSRGESALFPPERDTTSTGLRLAQHEPAAATTIEAKPPRPAFEHFGGDGVLGRIGPPLG